MAPKPFEAPDQIKVATSQRSPAVSGRHPLRRLCSASLAVSVLCAACGVRAEAAGPAGVYVAAAVTGSKLHRPKQTIANAPTPGATLHVVNAVDFGWGGQVEVGYAYHGVRIEAEIGRTQNHSDHYSAITPISVTIPQSGKNTTTRYMTNAFLDVPLRGLPIKPFVGGGIGAAHSYVSTFAAPARAPNAPPSRLMAFDDTRFAYQLMGGVGVAVSRHVSLTAQYRWLDSGTVHGLDARGERATRTLRGSNFDVGVRLGF